MDLAILVGVQASGKTTFYKKFLSKTHTHISKDLMGKRSGKQKLQMQQIEAELKAGRNVAVDNTNPSPADREPLILLGKAYGARIVVYAFPPDMDQNIERNRARKSKNVPELALYYTYRQFTFPNFSEGFDVLLEVQLNRDGFSTREIKYRLGGHSVQKF